MSLVTSTQRQVIDEAIRSYVRNYDRLTQQYLQLRQNILALVNEEESPQRRLKIDQYRYELAKIQESYSVHLKGVQMDIEILQIGPEPLKLASIQEELEQKQKLYEEQLKDLVEVKQPLLEKLRHVVQCFQDASDSKKAPKIKQLLRGGQLKDDDKSRSLSAQQLVFERSESNALAQQVNVGDIDFEKFVEELVETKGVFARMAGGKYLFDVARNNLPGTSVEEYDALILREQDAIRELVAVENSARDMWRENARKLDVMKTSLQEQN